MLLFTMAAQTVGLFAIHFSVGELGVFTTPVLASYWFLLAGIITVTWLRGAWPAAVGYLAAAVFSYVFPVWRHEIASLGNLVLAVTAGRLLGRQLRAKAAKPG